MDAGFCGGQVHGVVVTVATWRAAASDRAYICTPPEVSSHQAIRIVVKYLEDNPAQLHMQSVDSIMYALAKAFPCTGD